jgi:Putative prokaryotic signal transducing protein
MAQFEPSLSGRLVLVFTATSIPEGLLARSLLEADGIPVFVKGESEGPYRMGPVYLWVPDEFEVQAGVLLADAVAAAREATIGEESATADPDRPLDR